MQPIDQGVAASGIIAARQQVKVRQAQARALVKLSLTKLVSLGTTQRRVGLLVMAPNRFVTTTL